MVSDDGKFIGTGGTAAPQWHVVKGAFGLPPSDPSIHVVRDDGTTLVLSRAEASRVHDAFDRAVLFDDMGGTVGKCAGAKGCPTCKGARRA